MEETDILSQEDIEDIGAVIQLSPHVRTAEFELVTRSTEDEPLVSLDELYEKTGQESINTVVDGFKMIVERNRLARKHGLALKLQGSESWIPFADNLNVVRGAEGFFTNLKDGLVNIIKGILRFIKGICNWIVDRFKRLFGFEKTVNETKHLNERTEIINQAMSEFVQELGGGKEYDPTEFVKTLPRGKTDTEQLVLIKNRLDSNEQTFKRIEESLPAFDEACKIIDKIGLSTKKASENYRKRINDLRNKFKSKNVTVGDVISLNQYLQEEIFITLDYSELAGVLKLLCDSFYGIKIEDLGLEGSISKLRETLKSHVEVVKVKVDEKETKRVKESRRIIAAYLEGSNQHGINFNNKKFGESTFSKFSEVIKLDDAQFIKELSENLTFPEAKMLPGLYATCVAKIREFTEIVEISLKMVNDVGKTYTSICNWYARISSIVAAYITRDIKRIAEAHKRWLTEKERGEVEDKDGKPSYLFSMEEDFKRAYPGFNLPEEFSRLMVLLQEIDKQLYGDRIGNFIKQLVN